MCKVTSQTRTSLGHLVSPQARNAEGSSHRELELQLETWAGSIKRCILSSVQLFFDKISATLENKYFPRNIREMLYLKRKAFPLEVTFRSLPHAPPPSRCPSPRGPRPGRRSFHPGGGWAAPLIGQRAPPASRLPAAPRPPGAWSARSEAGRPRAPVPRLRVSVPATPSSWGRG